MPSRSLSINEQVTQLQKLTTEEKGSEDNRKDKSSVMTLFSNMMKTTNGKATLNVKPYQLASITRETSAVITRENSSRYEPSDPSRYDRDKLSRNTSRKSNKCRAQSLCVDSRHSPTSSSNTSLKLPKHISNLMMLPSLNSHRELSSDTDPFHIDRASADQLSSSIRSQPLTRRSSSSQVTACADSVSENYHIGCNRPLELIKLEAKKRTSRATKASFMRLNAEATNLEEEAIKNLQDENIRELFAFQLEFKKKQERKKFWLKIIVLASINSSLVGNLPEQVQRRRRLFLAARAITRIKRMVKAYKGRRTARLFAQLTLRYPWFMPSFIMKIRIWRKRRAEKCLRCYSNPNSNPNL
jgi:hypothetical protein